MQYKTHIVTNINDTFVKSWIKLWNESENSTIYNSYEWFQAYSENITFVVYACYEGEELVGVIALTQKNIFKVKCLVPLGYHDVGGTPILLKKYDSRIIESLFYDLLEKNICITNIDEDLSKVLRNIFSKKLFSLISVNPYLDLSEDFETNMSKSNLKEMKKSIRKNGDDFELKYFSEKDNLNKHLKTMISIENESSKKNKNMDILYKSEVQKSFTKMIKFCNKFVHIAFLYYKKEPIAYQFGFICKNKFTALQTAFLAKYRSLNPGRLMLYLLFQKLKKEKIKIVDLGGGISSYKTSFTPSYYCLYDIYSSNNALVMLWWKAINTARRAKQILFPLKHTRDHEFLFKTI